MKGGDLKAKILVVDDFPVMRRVVLTLLKQSGYTSVFEAEDGEVALEFLEGNPDTALVISDWDMPKRSGLDLLKTVKNDSRFAHVMFIMISSTAEKTNINEVMKAGADGYIVKPFTAAALREKLAKLSQGN